MRLSEVPAYVEARDGVKRSRQTVYNWATKGVTRGGDRIILQTEMKGGMRYTRQEWVDLFLGQIDVRGT